jgi:hypothetical protein
LVWSRWRACGSLDADVPGASPGGEKNADGWYGFDTHVTWDWRRVFIADETVADHPWW